MGDGADMALDYAWVDWEQHEEYINGNKFNIDPYDAGIVDEMGVEIGDSRLPASSSKSLYGKKGKRKPSSYACKHCGKKNLKWSEVEGKWRLFDKKIPHICKEYKKVDDENT